MGGGIHRIKRGGKLSIHKDYNEHPETKKQRRINLLIYLNENWESSWEGNLELWSNNTWKKSVEIEPIFNRAVIFNIENAPHGHPIPLNSPDNIDRYSLALYYFTDNFLEDDLDKYVRFYDEEDLGITKKIDDIFKV
jgi:Rps23 Pro-64 3,4-dihydroxylase Tpa1-like proline 4-hydroxylase